MNRPDFLLSRALWFRFWGSFLGDCLWHGQYSPHRDKRYAVISIKIDHHPNDDAYGDLLWVDTESSSTSELIALC